MYKHVVLTGDRNAFGTFQSGPCLCLPLHFLSQRDWSSLAKHGFPSSLAARLMIISGWDFMITAHWSLASPQRLHLVSIISGRARGWMSPAVVTLFAKKCLWRLFSLWLCLSQTHVGSKEGCLLQSGSGPGRCRSVGISCSRGHKYYIPSYLWPCPYAHEVWIRPEKEICRLDGSRTCDNVSNHMVVHIWISWSTPSLFQFSSTTATSAGCIMIMVSLLLPITDVAIITVERPPGGYNQNNDYLDKSSLSLVRKWLH